MTKEEARSVEDTIARSAMKQALEALKFDSYYGTGKQEAIKALEEALASEQEQDMPKIGCVNHDCDKCKKQEQGKPVAWRWRVGNSGWQLEDIQPRSPTAQPLYTTPQPAPQRSEDTTQKKPLTDEQIETLWHEDANCNMPADLNEFRHSIKVAEAAHGIKGDA